jgi:hypothetical protein
MSARSRKTMFLWSRARPARRAYNRFLRQCRILNIWQPYRPLRPVTGIALLYFLLDPCSCYCEYKTDFRHHIINSANIYKLLNGSCHSEINFVIQQTSRYHGRGFELQRSLKQTTPRKCEWILFNRYPIRNSTKTLFCVLRHFVI